MHKKIIGFLLFALFVFVFTSDVFAHFGVIIPSKQIVDDEKNSTIELNLEFMHPFEYKFMNLDLPLEFGVVIGNERLKLTKELIPVVKSKRRSWKLKYKISKPGDHIFYMIPKAYFEPAEDSYIRHYTKVIVNAFGLENGWDKPVGLKAEIIPLTRPYGLWKGNLFCGKVLFNGSSMKDVPVEIEYYNSKRQIKAPSEVFITQVVKTNENGEFCYSMPFSGWWGFAALIDDPNGMEYNGKKVGLEVGAVIWIKATGQE